MSFSKLGFDLAWLTAKNTIIDGDSNKNKPK
jgi:hypothetical protein